VERRFFVNGLIAHLKRAMTKREKLTINEHKKVKSPAVRGQPTKYRPEFVNTARLLAQGGATQDEIADVLGVSRRTINYWLVQHPEFNAAIQVGNEVFNPRVERALAERAIGFYADKYVWRETTEEQRKEGQPTYVMVPTERVYYPPDVTAAIYWTKNRMPDKWRDVNKHTVTGTLKSSDDFLVEIRKDILALQQDGYLKTIDLKALPTPKGKNGKR